MSRTLSVAFAAALLAHASPASAQGKAAPTPPATAPAPAAKDAAEIIKTARGAVAAANALSYTARTFGIGALEGKVPAYEGRVSAARADAGGWRLYIKGRAAENDIIEIGYDGVVARSIREKDKVVVEKTVSDSTDLGVFLSSQQCRHAVLWEVLGDAPLSGDETKARYEGTGTSDGQQCDIVFLPASGKGNEELDAGVQVWIAHSDHLPRRVTRFQLASDKTADPRDGRVLEVAELKIDGASIGGIYSPEVPSGYRVKVVDAAPKPKATPTKPKDGPAPPEAPGLLALGSAAPDWELKDGEGKVVKLSDLKGKVVLMDFWATWCPPCRAAMPSVQQLHEKYAGKNVAIFGVNCWERDDAAAYMAKKKFTYGLLLKADKVAEKYNVTGIPTFYLIGPDGKVLHAGSGFGPGTEATIEKKIDEALAAAK